MRCVHVWTFISLKVDNDWITETNIQQVITGQVIDSHSQLDLIEGLGTIFKTWQLWVWNRESISEVQNEWFEFWNQKTTDVIISWKPNERLAELLKRVVFILITSVRLTGLTLYRVYTEVKQKWKKKTVKMFKMILRTWLADNYNNKKKQRETCKEVAIELYTKIWFHFSTVITGVTVYL